ncbi:MAG: iron ABC transporter permease [Pyrinomonadaceae bacterium]|nr:iron ABC transporter permease [Pyrinomonadaceae bacterium]
MSTAATAIARRPFIWPSARAIVLSIAAILFVALCVLPTLYMLGVSLAGADGGFSLDNYRHLLTDARQRDLLLSSSLLGIGTAALATIIGAPLGLLLARADLPAKRFLRLALVVPLVIPPYILGLAWIYIGGSAGLLARVYGRDLLSSWTYSLTGAVITLSLGFFPLAMLATEAAARRVSAHLEEAALLVGPPHRVLRRITLPLIAPSIAASIFIIFVLALSEFGVPGLLRVPVFTTEVFTAFAALYDFGAATALAVPLLVLALTAGIAVKLLIGERMITTGRSTHAGLPLLLGGWRALAIGAVGLVLFLSLGLPLTVLAVEVGRIERIVSVIKTSSEAIANSLLLATIGATLIIALAVLLGYGRARARTRLRGLVDLVFIVVFAVPSTVVGIGLIGLWNRPGLPGEIYKSMAIILIAYLARFVPVAALILAASARQLPVSSEEAAEVAGAGWLRSFARIVLPQLRNGLAAAWVVAFIFAFGELGATVLVSPPGESTLPVRIYTMIANTPSSEVAALALMQASIIIIPLALLGVFGRGQVDRL